MQCAEGFLYNPKTKEVFLHLRDGNTPYSPHKWALFGGAMEEGETPQGCYAREMQEELAFTVDPDNIFFLLRYDEPHRDVSRIAFYSHSELPKSAFTLGEGADFNWFTIAEAMALDLSVSSRIVLAFFNEYIVY